MDFTGKHVIITGGSSGIGLATAERLAARGARLSLVARDPARLEAAAARLKPLSGSGRVEVAPADVSDRPALEVALADLAARLGPCDVLITSAGVTHPGYFQDLPDEVFRRMIEVDYFGTLYAIRAVTPGMLGRRAGSIVAISSGAGLIGVFGYSAYSPAKFAVRGLMETLRQELKPHGIHVGVAYPPDTDTPQLAFENQFKPAETRAVAGSIKPVSAERVAKAIVDGIERRRFVITADPQSALLARIGGLVDPILQGSFDKAIEKARRARAAGSRTA